MRVVSLFKLEKLAQKTEMLYELGELTMESSCLGSLLFLQGTVMPSTNSSSVKRRGMTSCQITTDQKLRELKNRLRKMAQNCWIQSHQPVLTDPLNSELRRVVPPYAFFDEPDTKREEREKEGKREGKGEREEKKEREKERERERKRERNKEKKRRKESERKRERAEKQ